MEVLDTVCAHFKLNYFKLKLNSLDFSKLPYRHNFRGTGPVCVNNSWVAAWQRGNQESNHQPVDHKSSAVTLTCATEPQMCLR